MTSQTKPGPNMAAAVAMKVSRKESMEEKEPVMCWARVSGISVFSGHCREKGVRGVRTESAERVDLRVN